MVGREWLRGCGFSPTDIHLIAHMSSWAVCGVRGHPGGGEGGGEEGGGEERGEEGGGEKGGGEEGGGEGEGEEGGEKGGGEGGGGEDEEMLNKDTSLVGWSGSRTVGMESATATSSLPPSSHPHPSLPPSYHPHPREDVGLMCKRLLDEARLHYLRERGMDGRLVYFVPRGTSLENILLIATPTQHD